MISYKSQERVIPCMNGVLYKASKVEGFTVKGIFGHYKPLHS
jgi:hypothetical protein